MNYEKYYASLDMGPPPPIQDLLCKINIIMCACLLSFYVVWNLDMVGLLGPFQSETKCLSIVITGTYRIKSGTSQQVLRNG
jgi:hypothetical protein